MKVLWLANIPSPYSVDFLNELGKLCELTVLFERTAATDRDDSWLEYSFDNFEGIVLKGREYSQDKAFCPGVIRYLKKPYDAVVVSNMATLTGILAIGYMRFKGKKYVIQGDGGFKKDGHGVKEKLKHFLISGADKCLSTGQAHDEYYLQYGSTKDKLARIPFTSLYEREIFNAPADDSEKQATRTVLDLQGETIVLTIGQFIHRKGFDILIRAANQLKPGTNVYIIGGKPTKEYEDLICENHIQNVFFRDFVSHDKLHQYFRAADVFVLPTREDIWGLVINEAMAHGLPVVTTDACIAGLELVEDGVNGYIIPAEQVEPLADAINDMLASDLIQAGHRSLDKIREYTFENTARIHRLLLETEK